MLPSLPLRVLIAAVMLTPALPAAPALEDAVALFKGGKIAEAREGFEKILAADPKNAAAANYLGQAVTRRGDAKALDDAAPWFEKAAALEPTNAAYLADYGSVMLQVAGKNTSISAANKGKEALEQALVLNPDNLDARQGLFQFYQQAPWPIGSSSKAAAQLDEIRKRDADLATSLGVIAKANAKDYATAFKLCDEVLSRRPDNYTALYQYGRTSSLSGQNLERGLACLQQCLLLPPPSPNSPSHSNAWVRLGSIHEKLQHPDEARAAYESALKLNPGNKQAADALAKLK